MVYSAKQNGTLGTGLFKVGKDVGEYITEEIKKIGRDFLNLFLTHDYMGLFNIIITLIYFLMLKYKLRLPYGIIGILLYIIMTYKMSYTKVTIGMLLYLYVILYVAGPYLSISETHIHKKYPKIYSFLTLTQEDIHL